MMGCFEFRDGYSSLTYSTMRSTPSYCPKSPVSLLLVRFHHILMKHAGVGSMMASLRNAYWIVGVRCLCKRVRRECFQCKKLDMKPYVRPIAPLPELRVSKAPPLPSLVWTMLVLLCDVTHLARSFKCYLSHVLSTELSIWSW